MTPYQQHRKLGHPTTWSSPNGVDKIEECETCGARFMHAAGDPWPISMRPVLKQAPPDRWQPACGGTEQPFRTRTGRRLLYCWNPAQDRHAYLDCDTDRILSDEEAESALDTY